MAKKNAKDSPSHWALNLWTFQTPTVIKVQLRKISLCRHSFPCGKCSSLRQFKAQRLTFFCMTLLGWLALLYLSQQTQTKPSTVLKHFPIRPLTLSPCKILPDGSWEPGFCLLANEFWFGFRAVGCAEINRLELFKNCLNAPGTLLC